MSLWKEGLRPRGGLVQSQNPSFVSCPHLPCGSFFCTKMNEEDKDTGRNDRVYGFIYTLFLLAKLFGMAIPMDTTTSSPSPTVNLVWMTSSFDSM